MHYSIAFQRGNGNADENEELTTGGDKAILMRTGVASSDGGATDSERR